MAAIAILATTSAQAADESESCRLRSEVISNLATNYGELPEGVGLTDAGNLIEILSTSDGSTWSIVVTTPDGLSCLVAAGEAWRELRETAAHHANLFHRYDDGSQRQ